MAERNANFNLNMNLNRQRREESLQGLRELDQQAKQLKSSAEGVTRAARGMGDALEGVGQRRRNLQRIADAYKSIAIGADDASDATVKAARLLNRVGTTRSEIKNLANDLGLAAEEAEQLGRALEQQQRAARSGRLLSADQRFGDLSRQVGLAGDVQSNLGALRGLSGIAGLGGVSSGVGAAGEIAALVEELPRLKFAASQLPDVISTTVSEIGGKGVGLIGAFGALAVVTTLVAKAAEKHRQEVRRQYEAEQELVGFLSGATEDQVRERIATLEAERQQLQENYSARQQQFEAERDYFSEISTGIDAVDDLGLSIAGASGFSRKWIIQLEEQKDVLNDLDGEIDKNQEQIDLLEESLKDGTVAANTAADAERKLAEERQKNNEEYANFAEQRIKRDVELRQLRREGDKKQIESERQQIQDRLEQAQAVESFYEDQLTAAEAAGEETSFFTERLSAVRNEIYDLNQDLSLLDSETLRSAIIGIGDALAKAEADASEAAANRIAVLQDNINQELEFQRFLEGANVSNVEGRLEGIELERQVLQDFLPELRDLAGTSEEAAAELERVEGRIADLNADDLRVTLEAIPVALSNANDDLQDEIDTIEDRRDEAITKLRQQQVKQLADLQADLNQSLADEQKEAGEKQIEAFRDYRSESIELEEDTFDKRLEIIKNAARTIRQAVGERDAKAAFLAKQRRKDELDDLEAERKDRQEELDKGYQDQLDTIAHELDKQEDAIQEKYRRQEQIIQTRIREQIQAERLKAREEIDVRQRQYQQEISQLQAFANRSSGIMSRWSAESGLRIDQFVNRALSSLGRLATAPSPVTSFSSAIGGRVSSPSQQIQQPSSIGSAIDRVGSTFSNTNVFNIKADNMDTMVREVDSLLSQKLRPLFDL